MLGGLPLANRVEPYVLGLPFLLFWIVAWVLITSGVMGLIYALDRTATAASSGTRAGSSLGRNFMPLMPKRVKYRKTQRGSRKGTASRNLKIDFGEFGLQTLERAWITNTQLEAARVALTRNMKRKGKLWIRIFPDKSVTSRPPETRMGKGKGQPEHWVATVRPGNILFELDGVPESVARESLRLAADKLPVRTKFLTRHHVRAA